MNTPKKFRLHDTGDATPDEAANDTANDIANETANDTCPLPVVGMAESYDSPAYAWDQPFVDDVALADMQAFNDLKAKRKKRRRKRIVVGVCIAAAVLLVAIGAMAWIAADQARKAAESMVPQVAPVEQGTYTETVSASGRLKPKASVSAAPEVEGIVGEVFVSEGDAVAAGQALYTIVNADLDKAVAQAQQGIDEAANGVAQAQAALDEARRARNTGEQAAQPAGGAPSASPGFDAESANASVRQAELALNAAYLAAQNAQMAYDEAVARAEKRTVHSSIAGSIIAVTIEPGKALGGSAGTASAPVQIADLSQMTVSIAVNEIDILKVSADQPAVVTFTAAPDLELSAQVIRIATAAAGASEGGDSMGGMGMGGAVTYAVDLLIAEPDPRLKPGMTAKATITTKTIEDALMVPISAIQSDGAGGSFVLVVSDPESMEAEAVPVEVLASDGLTAAVKGAITAGDSIVVSGGDAGDGAMGAAVDKDVAASGGGAVAAMG